MVFSEFNPTFRQKSLDTCRVSQDTGDATEGVEQLLALFEIRGDEPRLGAALFGDRDEMVDDVLALDLDGLAPTLLAGVIGRLGR